MSHFIAPPPLNASDRKRTARQLEAVGDLMSDGQWRTLRRLVDDLVLFHKIQSSEPGVSARLRQLRNDFGYVVERRLRAPGLHEYRLTGEVVEPRPKPTLHKCSHCAGTGVVP